MSVAHQLRQLPELGKAEADPYERIVMEIDLSALNELDSTSDDLQAVAAAAAETAIMNVGVGKMDLFNQINTRAREFAAERAAEMVSDIEDATRNMIREQITEGIDNKLNRDQLASSIADGDTFSDERALLIADTEIGNANGHGALAGLEEAQAIGVNVKKEWLDHEGACPICEDNANQGPIPLDEDFESGDDAPLAHPRCECTLIGVVDGE